MSMQQILDAVRRFDGVLELAPEPGSEYPELAWGDHFFYYAPDGRIPEREQPYATIVTKDSPGDTASRLDATGRRRLNIHVGRTRFAELTGEDPRSEAAAWDHAIADVVLPHPVYRAQGWISIVEPGPATLPLALELLRAAHRDAERRARRRGPDDARSSS